MPETIPTILIIVHNPEERAFLRDDLSQADDPRYEIVEEALGSRGLASALNLNPACMLLDEQLPDMSGLALLAQLQRQSGLSAWPVILLCGPGNEAAALQALSQGLQDYLVKGQTSSENLRRTVAKAIERTTMLRQVEQWRRELAEKNRELEAALLQERAERKQTETALEAQRAFLRQVIDLNPHFIFAKDRQGRFTLANQAVADAYGTTVEALVGQTDANFNPQVAEVEHFRHDDLEVMDTLQEKFILEEAITDAAGRVRWLQTIKRPLIGPNGLADQILGVATDITERRQVEVALRQSEWQQRLLAELGETIRGVEEPDELLFAIVQTIGEHLQVRRCLFVEIDNLNDRALIHREYCRDVPPVPKEYKVSDYSAETRAEMEAGHTVVNRDAQADPRTAAIYEKVYQPYGERAYIGVPLLRGGQWVSDLWVSTDTPRDWNPEEIALLETVAERAWLGIENARLNAAARATFEQLRQNEEALREGEQMLALAMRGGRMGAWWRDIATNSVWWSPELEELFGLGPNGFSGTEGGFYDFVYAEDRPLIAHKVEQAIAQQQDYLVEFRFHYADGSLRWMEGRGRAVYSPEGQPLRLYGIGIDITERKEAEEALRQAHNELEQRVTERTAELEHSLQELNQFTYVASHDLKAPLRAVKNLANWITSDTEGILPESSKTHLAKMQNRIERMEKFLDDLLTYSRVGRYYYQRAEMVDTGAVLKEMIDTLAPLPGFTFTLQPEMPVLRSQRILLEIVFKNLLDNALKHHHRPDGHIQISARELDSFIEFSITDDGPGIAPMFHERIFQIFQTLRPRDELEATGAGLAIVKKAVESQGGAIQLISAEGQGATFSFTWPKDSDINS